MYSTGSIYEEEINKLKQMVNGYRKLTQSLIKIMNPQQLMVLLEAINEAINEAEAIKEEK
jgi:hypothetical protein